jgi:hypothetical protein
MCFRALEEVTGFFSERRERKRERERERERERRVC